MSHEPETLSIGIGQYLGTLLRRWRTIAAATLIGVLLALAYLLGIAPSATATADLNLNVISTEPFNAEKSAGGLLDDAAEARIAQSYAVAENASKLLGGTPSAEDIRDASTVTTTSGTSVVGVSYAARSRPEAVRGADAVSRAYLDYRHDQAKKRVDTLLGDINARLKTARANLVTAYGEIAKAKPGTGEATRAQSDRQQITVEIQDLVERKNTLEGVDTAGGSILTAAENNPITYGPRKSYAMAAGLLAGMAVGFVVAFVLDRFAPRLRRPRDVARLTREPVCVSTDAPKLPVSTVAMSQLRVAREQFLARVDEQSPRMLILDDTGPRMSNTTLVFATVIGQGERKTRLILPQINETQLEQLQKALDLQVMVTQPGQPQGYESAKSPSLTVHIPTDTNDLQQSDGMITCQVQDMLARPLHAKTGPDERDLLVLPASAPLESILAGLRVSDDVILVHRSGHSRTERLREVLADAKTFNTSVVGSLFLVRGHRKEPTRTRRSGEVLADEKTNTPIVSSQFHARK